MNAIAEVGPMATNLQDFLGERETLLRQRAEIDKRLRLIDELISLSAKLLEGSPSQDLFADLPPEKTERRERNILSPSTITDYVRQVLIEHGAPLKRGRILRELDKRDVPVVGGDRAKVLGTMIWRARRADGAAAFLNTEKGYWPSDYPLPD